MTRVVTDGAADLPADAAASLGVRIVRGPVRLDGQPWEGDLEQFWAELGKGPDLPTTAAPSAAALAEAYRGDEPVLAVHASSQLSRTVERAREAAAGVPTSVDVVDSRSLSVGTGLVVMAVAEAARAALTGDPLVSMAETCVEQLHLHAMIDDVAFLVHGGRAGLVTAKAGRHARRHVIAVKGHVIPIRQVRHRAEAVRELVDHVSDHVGAGVSRWAVGHGDAPDIDEIVERLCGVFGSDPAYTTLVGAPVGSHMGPRSVVVSFLSDG